MLKMSIILLKQTIDYTQIYSTTCLSYLQYLQVNREYLGGTTPAPPLTTCFPLTQGRDYDGGGHLQEHPESMVRLKVSDRHQVNLSFQVIKIQKLLLILNSLETLKGQCSSLSRSHVHYCGTDCRVFKQGVQNQKDFSL